MFVSLMLGISEGNAFPGRQTLPLLISSISGRKKYTSQAMCSSAIQMQNAWCFSVWADSLCGESLESIMCARREERQRTARFIFHLLLLHHYDNARGFQEPVTDADHCFLCRAVVPGYVWMRIDTSHGEPAGPPAGGWGGGGILQVIWCVNKSLHSSLCYHEPGQKSRCWEAIEPLWLPVIHGCWQWSHPIALLRGVVEPF